MAGQNKVKLAVIDYGMGNLRSVTKAFEHAGADTRLVSNPSEVDKCDALILPGVGALGDCIDGLNACKLADTIKSWIKEDRPFLGICLGLQALFDYSEEGKVQGLGIIPGQVRRFELSNEYKIPHMGWNNVNFVKETPINKDIPTNGEQFYFVHSYHIAPENESSIWCKTNYEKSFASGINIGNCYATQFHPEKSHRFGMNFLRAVIEN